MNEKLYEIYEGTEPYLFISYSHQDNNQVIPIVRELQKLGYRVWYDTGIGAGSRWPDVIAEHLMNSNCVIAFISKNSIDSDNCQEEIYFAMEEHKPLIAVHLEKTKLSPGLRMRLSSRHALFRYDFASNMDFVTKLDSEKILSPSKIITHHTPETPKLLSNSVQVAASPSTPVIIHNTYAQKNSTAAEAFLSDYVNRYHTSPDNLFLSAVDLAVDQTNFTVRSIRYGLQIDERTALRLIQQMQEMRLVNRLDSDTYHININHVDWDNYKSHIRKTLITKQSRWLF